MNKKVNTAIFIVGATLVNVVLMIILFVLFLTVYGIIAASRVSPGVNTAAAVALFVISIVGTYFIYHRIVAYMSGKVNMERYFAPIFRPRGKR